MEFSCFRFFGVRISGSLFALLMCLSLGLQSQTFSHLNFSTTEGLPSSEVYETFQDTKGHIWILTGNGLARFNGYEMEVFSTQNGLPSNTVFRVIEDEYGKVWFLTEGNLLCYYDEGKIHEFAESVPLDSILRRKIPSKLFFDEEGHLGIACLRGKSILLDTSGAIIRTWTTKSNYLEFEKYGDEVVATQSGLIRNERRTGSNSRAQAVTVDLPVADTSFPLAGIGKAYPWYCGDGEEFFAFSFLNTVHIFSKPYGYHQIKSNVRVNHLFWDLEEAIWLSTRDGLYRYYFEKGILLYEKVILPSKLISGTMRDNEGGYWISTLDQGVYYLRSVDFQIVDLGPNPLAKDVRRISGFGDHILAATQGPDFFLLKDRKVVQEYSLDNLQPVGDRIWNILPVPSRNSFLLAPQFFPLLKLNLNDLQVREAYPNQKVRPRGIAASRNGDIWGIRQRLTLIKEDSIKYFMKIGIAAREIIEDSFGIIWVSNRRGLYRVDGEKFTYLGANDSLLAGPISSMVPLPDGSLLLGSNAYGLIHFREDKAFQIPGLEGMTGTSVNHIFPEGADKYWLGTNKGVILIQQNGASWSARNFSTNDGLSSDEVHQVYVKDGKVWAATSKGINAFQAHKISDAHAEVPLYLQRLKVNGKNTEVEQLHPIELAWWENTIDLNFYAISFRQIGKLRYRYRLAGLANSEVEVTNTHVQYNQLPAGDYRFEVETSDVNGKWSSPHVLVAFSISLPWWQKWWFIGGCLILAIGFIFFLFKARVQRVRRSEQARTRVNELEKKALQAQMNPHFLFNSLNAIQSYVSANETSKAEEYLADFSRLIRLILENSRNSYIDLSKELELLEKYMAFEKLRFQGRISFEMQIDPSVLKKRIMLPPMLLQPFVENAVEHGLANKKGVGNVKLRFELQGELLFCEIEDDGIGRTEASQKSRNRTDHSSAGMMITRERLQHLNQQSPSTMNLQIRDLYDDNGVGIGTIVELRIPYQTYTES